MPLESDIIIKRGDARFHYRIAGVILERGRVLLQQINGMDFWFLPGGHGTLLEPAKDALKREISEELSTNIEIGRMVWVVENFFRMEGKFHHEIGLYFLANLPANSKLPDLNEFRGKDGEYDQWEIINKWHSLSGIAQINIVPSFLRTRLQMIPEQIEYISHKDDNFLH